VHRHAFLPKPLRIIPTSALASSTALSTNHSIAEYWLRRDFGGILLLFNFGLFIRIDPKRHFRRTLCCGKL
jgi:hypothetical protein